MDHWHRRLKYLFHRDERAGELAEEMRTHVEMRADRLRDRGLTAEEARLAARRQFGNRAALEIAGDAAWGWTSVERLMQDVRLGARSLWRTPGFAAIAVLTLGVGLGMNTAIFTIVNAVMLRSLPYPEPERIISLWEERESRNSVPAFSSSGSDLGGAGGRRRTTVSVANLPDYRAVTTFEELAGVSRTLKNLTGEGAPERIPGEAVTSNYLRVLGVPPALGRMFSDTEDREGAEHVVVLSHEFWQRRLGGDTAVLGRRINLDGEPYAVIGVMPRGFQSATQFANPDRIEYWVPAAYPADLLLQRGDHEIGVVGRLRPGHSVTAAQQQLTAVSEGLDKQFPETNHSLRAVIAPLREDITKSVSDSLHALWGASGLIVLITCVNVANLLLVRAMGRRHDTSVRMALGAGRTRVARQFLVESLLVAAAGCVTGLALGQVLMRLLVSAAPANVPRLDGVTMDWYVFLAAAGVATLTGLAFGLAPALQASRTSPGESLKMTERKASGRPQARWRTTLTVVEVALSIVLIVGAGLFLKSFATIMGMNLGFRTENVLAMNIALPDIRYKTADERLRFFEDLEQRVRALPGVQNVAYANRFPMRGGWGTGINIEGLPESSSDTDSQAVSPGYFETLGVPLIRGRVLTQRDRKGQPYVAVVNQQFEREFLSGGDAIGRRVRRGDKQPWVTVVGVVNDVRRGGKTDKLRPQIYLSAAQTDIYPVRLADFAVRASGSPSLLVKPVQQQVWAIDKHQPITGVRTMQEIIDRSVSEQRFEMMLLVVFAGVAVALAVIGISGVLSYSVNQRRNEIGVRMALGASPGRIVRMMMRQAGVMIGGGVVLGLGGALAVTRLVAKLLFHVRPYDAATYVAAIGLLVLVAIGAALAPALRGSRVDPMVALRDQ
jgi:putative ABC transport system permease protein